MSDMDSLLKLSGMAYHGGHTPEHWIALVGVDPRTVPEVLVSNGRCYWTEAAERTVTRHWARLRRDGRMLVRA